MGQLVDPCASRQDLDSEQPGPAWLQKQDSRPLFFLWLFEATRANKFAHATPGCNQPPWGRDGVLALLGQGRPQEADRGHPAVGPGAWRTWAWSGDGGRAGRAAKLQIDSRGKASYRRVLDGRSPVLGDGPCSAVSSRS
jgi:hypothetical protein